LAARRTSRLRDSQATGFNQKEKSAAWFKRGASWYDESMMPDLRLVGKNPRLQRGLLRDSIIDHPI